MYHEYQKVEMPSVYEYSPSSPLPKILYYHLICWGRKRELLKKIEFWSLLGGKIQKQHLPGEL